MVSKATCGSTESCNIKAILILDSQHMQMSPAKDFLDSRQFYFHIRKGTGGTKSTVTVFSPIKCPSIEPAWSYLTRALFMLFATPMFDKTECHL